MSKSKAWTDEWLKAQQKFVKSWSDMSSSWDKSDTSSQSDLWANGLDKWRSTYPYPDTTQPETNQVIDKCMDIGKGYFAMAEQIGKQVSAGGNPQDVVQQWLEQIKSGLQQQASHWLPMQQQTGHDFMSQWMGPSTNWQKMVAAMMPIEMPGSDSGIYGIGEDFDQISKRLSMPGIGFFRESQEKQQLSARLALEYIQANHKFNASFAQVSIESLQAFQKKLATSYENNSADTPSSLRAIYNLWVDISEAHYADYAMSEEYQTLYGDMVNKLMALKQLHSQIIDETMESLNLPSRKELDTVHQRLQQVRRENRSLRQELKEIRALLTEQKPATSQTEPVKPVARKTPRKKAAVVKKAGRKAGT